MNRWGTPDAKDLSTPVGNPLRYPRRVLLQLLQSAFSEETLLDGTNPFLLKMDPVTGDVAKDSKVVLADTYTDELAKTEPRPCVLIGRGDFGFLNLSIGEKKNWSVRGSRQQFADMTEVPIITNCVSRRDTESEDLAWVVTGLYRLFKTELRKKSQLFRVSDPRVGAPVIVKADSQADLYLTPVSLVVNQTVAWDLLKQLRSIELRFEFYAPNETEPFAEVEV